MKNLIGYYVGLSIVRMISFMPFRVLYVVSDILYFPLYYIIRYRRRIVHKNLVESFPEKALPDIIKIEKAFYHFFIDLIFESCKTLTISTQEIQRRMRFVNAEMVNDVMSDGRSVSAFIGHYGNWEWLSSCGLWFIKEATVAQIYHPLNNKAFDLVIKKIRERLGNICVEMDKTARYVAKAVKTDKPYLIGLIADQSPRKKDSVHFIKFLNHEVPVLTGTERITKHFELEAVFVSVKRVRRGFYECSFLPLHNNPKSLPNYELTKLYYERLEYEILQHPEYYLWTHNRFRYARLLQQSSL